MIRDDLKSNPFDVINQLGFEIARALLFHTNRFKDDTYLEGADLKSCDSYLRVIKQQTKLLETMSDEDVAFLKETAKVNKMGVNQLNGNLFSFFNSFNTEYSYSTPYLGVDFEKRFYSEEKQERLQLLRGFVDSNTDLDLNNLADYIHFGAEDCICSKQFNALLAEFKDYDLCSDDVDYMQSYKKSKEE